MKYLVAFTILLMFQSSSALDAQGIEDFLEDLRLRMCHPIEKFGLPALDPFTIENKESFGVNIKDLFMYVYWFIVYFELFINLRSGSMDGLDALKWWDYPISSSTKSNSQNSQTGTLRLT